MFRSIWTSVIVKICIDITITDDTWCDYIVHFSADFCLDVKTERANVWAPFIILIMVGWEAAPPQLGNVKIVPVF